MRRRAFMAKSASLMALVAAIGSGLAPRSAVAQRAADVPPQEVDGQINGQKARFAANGDDVLVSVAEADRLGLSYRDGKRITIGGTPLWLLTLESVTVNGQTRLAASAGVVPSIPGYFAALRAHPAEAFARSREISVEIYGIAVRAYDLGVAGVLLAPAEAERAGLKYRDGKQQAVGPVQTWVVEVPVKIGIAAAAPSVVTVAEPEPFFEAAMAGASRPK